MNSSHRTESVYAVFVCSGNICRPPTAEIIVRDVVEVNALVDGALLAPCEIGGWHVGEPVDEQAQAELENTSYDPNHTAAQLGDGHMDATLFIAIDESHINGLLCAGVPEEKIHLMRSFNSTSPKGVVVADPYYGGSEGFVRIRNEIETATPGTIVWLRETLALASER